MLALVGRSGRRQLGTLAPQPRLPRLRRAGGDRRRRRLPGGRGDGASRRRRDRGPARAGAGDRPGPGRAAARLQLGAHRAVPWLAGWDWEQLDPEVRKSFEVALHGGAAAALLIGQRRTIRRGAALLRRAAGAGARRSPSCRPPRSATCSSGRSSGVWAGRGRRRPGCWRERRRCWSPTRGRSERGRGDATPADGLALGVAQAAALAPGVSRNGVTLAAARWRRFSRDQANLLSRTIALPIIVGATVLKGERLRRRGAPPGLRRSLAIGVGASFASTLASQRLIGLVERDRALWPYAAYRAALAAASPRKVDDSADSLFLDIRRKRNS